MIEVEANVREWGRSLGVVLPKEKLISEGIGKDDTVMLLVAKNWRKKSRTLKDAFGTMKFRKSTLEMLKESDEEAWDE